MEGALPGGQQPDTVHSVMVKMMVAAIDCMGLRLQRRIAFHPGIRVRHDPVAILFQQKTGMSQPGYAHMYVLL